MNLLPRPRVVEEGGGTVAGTEPVVRAGASLPAQGYELSIAADGVKIDVLGRTVLVTSASQVLRQEPESKAEKVHGD